MTSNKLSPLPFPSIQVMVWCVGLVIVAFGAVAQPVQGRLGTVRNSRDAVEPATRDVTGTDLSTDGSSLPSDSPALSPYLILKPPTSQPGTETRPYSPVEYGRIVRSLMRVGGIPLAINYTPGQSILPDGFERDALRRGAKFSALKTRMIDVLDRGILVAPTREAIRLRGVRIPSQYNGTDSARAAGREGVGILRDMIRAGEISVVPGVPVRDNSGAILVDIVLPGGETLNTRLIREGLAMTEPADMDPGNAAVGAALQKLQVEARRNRLGLWGRR